MNRIDLTSAPDQQRRRFIRQMAITATLLTAPAPLNLLAAPVSNAELNLGNKIYRGTADGRILLSEDGGQNWRTLAQFGAQHRVGQLMTTDRGAIKARLSTEHGCFWLQSDNDHHWFTEHYYSPSIL